MIIIIKWFITALSVLGAAYLVPGIDVDSFYIALIVAFLLGIVNTVVWPILVVLTLPINLVTLGLFIFVINGVPFLVALDICTRIFGGEFQYRHYRIVACFGV